MQKKENKRNTKGAFWAWPGGLLVLSAQRKKKERNKKESVWFVWCIRGPKGVGGPPGVSRLSCRSSKILVSVLGKFRRFGEYINSIRYLDETYY